MTKLEEVARAIFDAQEKLHSDNRQFENAAIWRKQECLVAASAAVEAIKNPTSYMIADAANAPGQQTYGDVWRIMCAAILNETTEETK